MGGFIIIIIFVAIGIYTSVKSQKNREIIQKKFGENFPFPPLDEEQMDQEGYRFDDTPIEGALADEMQTYTVESTTAPYKPVQVGLSADTALIETKTTKAKTKFDLRQAVIYSEILKPKFNDNIL